MKKIDSIALLASAVVILAGAIGLGLGGITEALSEFRGQKFEHNTELAGFWLLGLGVVSFLGILTKLFKD
ncbi:MAG: hypothetical protein HOK62_11605 [Verrucomicrobiales bacterium]|jgi:divalent metal cation (Fe/Co/Zn/Cd) transporter|nr:hypothetical protein [Verrucomicrobiales bacterium]|tara:strand:- start:653 stop:862 length:210 start_codon:yes stop_codon:yes gene_type:complete